MGTAAFVFFGGQIPSTPYRGKFLSKPSKESVKNFLHNVKSIFRKGYGLSRVEMIKMLNPKITGWANYYRATSAKSTYSKVDNAIYEMCIYWALRKYQHQRRRKAVAEYFRRQSITRNWIFSDILKKKDGKKEVVFIKK